MERFAGFELPLHLRFAFCGDDLLRDGEVQKRLARHAQIQILRRQFEHLKDPFIVQQANRVRRPDQDALFHVVQDVEYLLLFEGFVPHGTIHTFVRCQGPFLLQHSASFPLTRWEA